MYFLNDECVLLFNGVYRERMCCKNKSMLSLFHYNEIMIGFSLSLSSYSDFSFYNLKGRGRLCVEKRRKWVRERTNLGLLGGGEKVVQDYHRHVHTLSLDPSL